MVTSEPPAWPLSGFWLCIETVSASTKPIQDTMLFPPPCSPVPISSSQDAKVSCPGRAMKNNSLQRRGNRSPLFLHALAFFNFKSIQMHREQLCYNFISVLYQWSYNGSLWRFYKDNCSLGFTIRVHYWVSRISWLGSRPDINVGSIFIYFMYLVIAFSYMRKSIEVVNHKRKLQLQKYS